jgi:hypothetical protein
LPGRYSQCLKNPPEFGTQIEHYQRIKRDHID